MNNFHGENDSYCYLVWLIYFVCLLVCVCFGMFMRPCVFRRLSFPTYVSIPFQKLDIQYDGRQYNLIFMQYLYI